MSTRPGVAALVAVMMLAVGAGAAHAQRLTGSWQGMAMGMAVWLTVQPGGVYVETQRSGSIMTQQTGAVKSAGAGMIAFTVADWRPRTMPRYVPTGASGGYWMQIPTTQPPGGVWRIRWNGASSFTLTDVRLGGSITMNRAG